MKDNKLTINIHFMPGNKGSLVFKKTGAGCGLASFRLNRMCEALGFVGSMKQLLKAIKWGGDQHCFYPLKNDTGREWFLYCRTSGTLILIAVCDVPDGEAVFEWEGTVEGFRNGVEGMVAEPYTYFI